MASACAIARQTSRGIASAGAAGDHCCLHAGAEAVVAAGDELVICKCCKLPLEKADQLPHITSAVAWQPVGEIGARQPFSHTTCHARCAQSVFAANPRTGALRTALCTLAAAAGGVDGSDLRGQSCGIGMPAPAFS